MDHEDPTLDVEAALREEEALAALAELGAAWTAEEEQPSATPLGAVQMAPAEAAPPPEAKRQKAAKTAADLVAEFAEIRECVAQGLLTRENAREMCARLMRGE